IVLSVGRAGRAASIILCPAGFWCRVAISVTFQILPEIRAGGDSTPICWHQFQGFFLRNRVFDRLTRTTCNVTGARRSAAFWTAVTLYTCCRCLHCEVAQSCLQDIAAPQKPRGQWRALLLNHGPGANAAGPLATQG